MNRNQERLASNALYGMAIGTLLFLAGLSLTVWSWGLATPLGVPLMMAGVGFPFLEAYMASHGQEWAGFEGPVVMDRKESGHYHGQTLVRHNLDG